MQPSQTQPTKPVMDVTAPAKSGAVHVLASPSPVIAPATPTPAAAKDGALKVTAPTAAVTAAPPEGPVAVQKAPATSTSQSVPSKTPLPVEETASKDTLRPGPQSTTPSLPIAAIMTTLFVMVLLSALAIMVYIQSNA